MKNILLTGSGGFIGKHLKQSLSKKYNLYTPRSCELNLLDLPSIEEFFDNNKVDFIIHSASYGVKIMPDATLEEIAKPNIQMFKNLAKFATENCPMITLGSGAEYDKSKPLVKVKEDHFGKSIPKDPYGYSKYIISKEIEKHNHILNLRIFGVYGFGEDPSRVITYMIKQNLSNQKIELRQNVVFDFVYIDDLCKIINYFIEHKTDEKFINICSGQSVEIKQLAQIINYISDFDSDIIIKNDGLNKEYTGDNQKLLSYINGLDFTPLEKGIEILFNGIQEEREQK